MDKTPAPQQAPKEHCDHECVCMVYDQVLRKGWRKPGKVCTDGGCEHDTRSRPHPAPARSGCDGCRKETEHLECPMPGHCDQMKCPICCEGSDFPTLPEEIKKYEADAARQAREEYDKELWIWCLQNGAQQHGDLIGLPTDPFFPLKLIKKIAEMHIRSTKPHAQER